GVILAIVVLLLTRSATRVGIVHVLERLSYHEGHLPLKNAVTQFFGAAVAIISGQSVGREGPAIHLGAAAGSLLGQEMRLPNNSIRTLVACGAAGAIAASFNTPLAGVVFAMEVIMMEYTIAGFIPVIIAAVSATAINRLVFGDFPAFIVPALQLNSIWELILILLMGIAIGCVAALFINGMRIVTRAGQKIPYWSRLLVAGISVGIIAQVCPQVMGIGYDTVNAALDGSLAIGLLVLIIVMKMLATMQSNGLGVPGGLIGPILFIGCLCGSFFGVILEALPFSNSDSGLYAMLGMGAMMGATLQAPLAALLALLELTGNQNIIFPGMLVIVSANLAARELFGCKSIYLSQMHELGLDYRNDPVAQSLRRIGVTAVMNTRFAIVQPEMTREQATSILRDEPQWLVISRKDSNLLMPAADLLRFIQSKDKDRIIMTEVPAKRLELAPVPQQATLEQARKILDESDAEALYVITPLGHSADRIFGIITRQDIEARYQQHASPV
ncbi:MAG: chloride channel protein, partial [Gammaproteobacteria bacterium]|nr:chloride channel protein [Gammaproteobacteria bacterium]